MLKLDINLLYTIINIIVLFILLRLFLFKPVKKVLKEREEMINNNLKEIEDKRQAVKVQEDQAQQKQKRLAQEADAILEDAQQRAELQEAEILKEAKEQASEIIETANKQAEENKKKLLEQTQGEIVDLALQAAVKIIGEQSKTTDSQKLNDIVDGVEAKKR